MIKSTKNWKKNLKTPKMPHEKKLKNERKFMHKKNLK